MGILSCFGSRVYPSSSSTLKARLSDVAKYEFQIKPIYTVKNREYGYTLIREFINPHSSNGVDVQDFVDSYVIRPW